MKRPKSICNMVEMSDLNMKEHSVEINKRQEVYYSNSKGYPQHKINEKKRQPGKLTYDHIKASSKYKFTVEMRKRKTPFNRCVHKFKFQIKSEIGFLVLSVMVVIIIN